MIMMAGRGWIEEDKLLYEDSSYIWIFHNNLICSTGLQSERSH